MEKSLTITVLISVYRGTDANGLFKALNSTILNQTIRPNSCVLVCDGPVSLEVEIMIENFNRMFPLVIIKLEKNVGLGPALNEGIKYCVSDLIMRMDCDDVSHPLRVEKLIKYFTRNPHIDVVGSQVNLVDSEGKITGKRIVPTVEEEIYKFMLYRSPFNHPTVCFKLSAIAKVNGYRAIKFLEDYDLWTRMYSAGFRFGNIPEVLLDYYFDQETVLRRGDLSFGYRELIFQLGLLKCRIHSPISFLRFGMLRVIIRLIGPRMRGIIYKQLLS